MHGRAGIALATIPEESELLGVLPSYDRVEARHSSGEGGVSETNASFKIAGVFTTATARCRAEERKSQSEIAGLNVLF
jgi:hypothetical protein